MFKRLAIIITLVIIALFANAQDAFALYYYGGSGDGFDVAIGANADVVTIGSAAQTFLVGDSATAISTITVEMEAGQPSGGINTTDDIRVKIPTSLDMVWDSTDTTATVGGSASGKVSTTVSYEDSNKTLVIEVTTNFANEDNITVSDLSFKDFNSVGFDNLELEIDNAGTTAATDSNRKTISLPASSATFTGGSGDGFGVDENIRYWVASADGNWNDTANWSDTSAGTSGFSVPASGQVALFDLGSTNKCTVNIATVSLQDLILESGYTGASAIVDANANDITVSVNVTLSGGELEFDASSDLTVGGTLTVSGGTLDGLNGTIDANGAFSLSSGTLTAPSGTFTVAGNWTKTGGTFTSGTGTVTFDAGSGTQAVTSGGVTDNDDFYNITHSGAGTLQLQDAMVIKHDLTNSAGTWDANAQGMSVYEDFANTATFTHSNNTVTFRGAAQSDITGDNTFYNLTIDTNTDGAKTVRFGASSTQTVANTLSMTGYTGKILTIRSTADGTQGTIDIPASITSGVDYVDVKDSKIDDANYTITAGTNSTDSGNNINWIFGSGVARTITGSLYQSDRTTKLTSQTVKLSVNGASVVQQTASSGDFTFSNILLSSGDTILVWIDDDATYEGNTITVSDGNNLSGLNVYASHVTVRYETGSSITNANLSTAKGTLGDDDIKYSVTGGNLTVNDNFEFFIPATYTHAPGGTITVDDIEIDGTLNANGSDVTVSGDWDNSSGSYISGNNTTTFDGSSKQTLTSGGTGDTNDFYNLTHSGSAELELAASEPIDVDGTLTQSGAGDFDTQGNNVTCGGLTVSNGSFNNDARAGTWDVNGAISLSSGILVAASGNLSVSGAWNKTGGTFTHNSGTVTFNGSSAQTVTTDGSAFSTLVVTNASDYVTFNDATTCVDFTAQTPSSKIKFKEGVDFTVTGTLTLNGQAAGTEIELISALDGTDWNLNLNGNSGTASYVKVKNSNASNGAVTASNSIDLGSNPNWTFQAVTRYWLGTANANWNNTSNWSSASGGAGGADVPSTGDTAIFDGNGNNPCTLNIATVSLAVLDIQAGYTSKLDTNGNDITASGNVTVAAGATGELELDINSQLTVSGTLTVSGGTLDGLNGTIDANGAVSISGGELIAPSGNFNVAGNFSHSAGTFTHSSGTVIFDGAGAGTISGDTTFYNLTCTTAGKQINFTAGTTQTVNNTLTLTGASGNLITLRSTSAGSKWDITSSGATQTVSYIDVKDADANSNTVTCYNSTDSGNNNANWVFNTIGITSPTDGKTVDTTPCVIGTAGPSDTVTLKDKDGATVATTAADTNGNFRVVVSTALATGANSLTPYVGAIPGSTINITVVTSPTSDQVPTVTSPTNGQRISGATPTCSGKGLAGQSVSIKANDANGNLLLQEVGSGTVDASGNYSITLTTALPKGENYLTLTVDGVTSDICTVSLTDPFGVVFDSVTNNPIQGATVTIFTSAGVQCTPGVEIDAGDSNPQTTAADGAYSFLTINGDFYITVSASGYTYPSTKSSFPAGRTIVTGSKGEIFTVAGAIIEMDHPLDSGATLLKIEKDANKKDVVVGDVVTYTVTIKNETASDVTSVYLEDKIPPGFKYLSGKVTLDGTAISDPTGNRPITFNIGTVSTGTTRTLKYQLVVGSGVTFGKYENSAHALYSDGTVISNTATETVKVIPDPLFDLGTVIGKVFWDVNENGIQDTTKHNTPIIAETGISNVRIVMEDGTVIITDKDGKYHVPGVIPGRHAFRLDESTLPDGAYLTTPKVVIVDIRQGLTSKVNFGVNIESEKGKDQSKKLPVKIIHERGIPQPRLNITLNRDVLEVQLGGGLKEAATFRMFTNYALFIDKWSLEIFDKDTGRLFKRFEGGKQTLSRPIMWSGMDDRGNLVRPERSYIYVLTVWDKHGKSDKTKEREFKVSRYEETDIGKKEELEKELFGSTKEKENEKEFWLTESRANNLDTQTITLDGETVVIKGSAFESDIRTEIRNQKLEDENQITVKVIQAKQLEGAASLEVSECADIENFQQDIIVPKGEHKVIIKAKDTRGETIEYAKNIKVGDDYFFFIAMGDGEMGYNIRDGNTEAIDVNDRFKKGLWLEGKLAYYLKAKIKGKYLITSSLDTKRDQKELFKYIDPDKYYPVYGDSSTISYEASDTQGMLYCLVEWDRSKVMWGNYNIGLTDTEFAQFSRTLYGGKAQLISTSDTKFGEPNTKLITFMAKAKQKAAHNEFIGTGVSLYYLKHKYIVEGSDKVRIEVRDKITGLVITSLEQKEGSDYQIDYDNGRIIFWKPVSQIVESKSIISSGLLDGNKLYVVVDYEYATKDKHDQWSKGARASQQLSDYLRVGGTYVQDENQAKKNYELYGADTTLRLGDDIRFDAEYAETKSEKGNNFISTDGGLSFNELPTDETAKGKAYGLKGEAKFFNRLGLSGYYKRLEKGFSTPSSIANQGTEKIGGAASLDILPGTRISARHDIQKLLDDGSLEARAQVGAKKTETTTVQLTSELTKKLEVTGEYRHQRVSEKKDQYEAETNEDTDTVAGRLAYKPTEKVRLSVEHQETLKSEKNRQTTVGAEAKLNEHLSLKVTETVGTKGNATTLGAGANINDKVDLFADYTVESKIEGDRDRTVSVGGKAKIDENSSVYNTYSVTDSDKGEKRETVVFGGKKKLDNGYEVSMGREFSKQGKEFATANTYGAAKEIGGKRIEGTFKQEQANNKDSTSDANIFGLSGDINDRWATSFNFEKGKVQNLDGTQTKRIAVSGGASYVDKDRIKASSKLELRLDEAQEDTRQILAYNAIEGKITEDLTLFGKANISHTENTSTNSTTANFKEMVLGAAYRPIYHDKLNLIGKYTFLEDDSPAAQSDFKDIDHIKAHVFGLEGVYDLTDKFQLVEKGAYKHQDEKVSGFDFTETQTWLLVNRVNYNLTRDWQIGGEYRMLSVVQAEDLKQGALLEVSRRIGEFVRVGAGYNFTDFSDDLTDLDYTVHGPFVRMTGVLYDRTPQEVERLRKRELEENIKKWAWELVNEELARPDSEIMKELYNYFYLAKLAHDEGRLKESKELYAKIQDAGKRMYEEAEGYVKGRVELEKKLKSYNDLAKIYYKEDRLFEARELWKKIIIEAKAEPISFP